MLTYLQPLLRKHVFAFACTILFLNFTDTFAQQFQQGDVFVAVGNGQVQWRRATGTLVQTLNTGQGGFTTGMAFDASGNLYVTNFSANSVSKFNTSGVLQGTFGSGYSTPESIVFDNGGNVYVGNLGNGVRKFNSSGAFLSTVVPGRIDFFDLAADQCTILYTQEGSSINRYNGCTNTTLPNFANSLGGSAFALRIRQNGDVLLANGSNILRLNSSGSVVQNYGVSGENSWFALNLNPDGTSFWSANFNTANVYKIDIATGNVLSSFNTGTGSSSVFGLAVFGEFTISVCADNIAPAFVSPSPTCGSTINGTVGSPLNFTVTASDGNSGDVVALSATGIPSGATLTPSLPTNGNPVSTTFNWTPSSTGTSTVIFNAQDKCVITGCTYTLNVVASSGNIYYSKSSGDLHNVLTWGLNPDGSGPNPPDFGSGKIFQLANRPGVYTMTGDWSVGGTINIPSASQLQIAGNTLSITDLAGPGSISGSSTSNMAVIGSNGGNVNLNFTGGANMLNNFTVNRSGSGASATLTNALDVLNVLTLTTGALNTGGMLTLKSSAANTARVAPVTGAISGDVTVERFIPMRRAWRILSAPISGSQTINQAWQEGAILGLSANPDPFPGYGTHITGGPVFGTVANGFDQNPIGASSSIKTYINNTWQPLPNTNATPVGGTAYMTFVRGNRALPIGYNDVSPSNTTLREKGALRVGDQTFTVAGTGFTAIPNPYASPINFATITRNGVQNNFYLWDPKMATSGAYVLLSFNGSTYDVTPASVSPESQYIQSGQGFLVQASTSGVSGSITIKESDKSATPAMDVFRVAGGGNVQQPLFRQENLRITLKAQGTEKMDVLDEAMVSYSSNYSNKIDNLDAQKPANINENLAIVNESKDFMIERREIMSEGDVVQLKLWNTQPQAYTLEITPSNFISGNLKAVLEDKYLHTSTPIDMSAVTMVSFTIGADAASARGDRFRIVIGLKIKTESEEKKYVSAYPNPLTGTVINLVLGNQEKGTYEIALISASGNIVFAKSLQYKGGSSTERLQLPRKPVPGAYQLRVSGKGGSTTVPLLIN